MTGCPFLNLNPCVFEKCLAYKGKRCVLLNRDISFIPISVIKRDGLAIDLTLAPASTQPKKKRGRPKKNGSSGNSNK